MYSIDTNARLKLVTVTFSGAVDIAERSSAWNDMAKTIEALGNCRILLDFQSASVKVDEFQVSQVFARQVTDFGRAKERRVAYLCRHGAHVNMVVETLANARGLALERFDDRAEAMGWLLSDRPDQAPPATTLPRGAKGD